MRILFIDDHQLVREALAYYLKAGDANIDVVEAGSLSEIADGGRTGRFDLILLDYQLPGVSGSKGVSLVRGAFPDTPIVVLSGAITREDARSALLHGAAGVISKDIEGSHLMDAIREAILGEKQIAGLCDQPPGGPIRRDTQRTVEAEDRWGLSKRELQVANLLIRGLSNKEIAAALGIADITVRLHLRRLFRKLDARSRTDAVRIILT